MKSMYRFVLALALWHPNLAKVCYASVPISVDWRKYAGVSTKVKNQGQCRSSWAFAAVGAVEAYYAVVKGQKGLDLSEQQLVDCAEPGFGCSGDSIRLTSLQSGLYWAGLNGLLPQGAYPYTAREGTCKTAVGAYKIGSAQKVAANQASLQSAVTQRPLACMVDSSNWSSYKSGILSNCGTSLDHWVLVMGFWHENGTGYWLIKNSWGTAWGESGYIRIKDGNTCGILSNCYLAA